MRKSILTIIVLIVSGVFTSCTDLEGKVVPEKVEKQELENTVGEDEQDPDEEDDDPTGEG